MQTCAGTWWMGGGARVVRGRSEASRRRQHTNGVGPHGGRQVLHLTRWARQRHAADEGAVLRAVRRPRAGGAVGITKYGVALPALHGEAWRCAAQCAGSSRTGLSPR